MSNLDGGIRMLVITSCTGMKSVTHPRQLSLSDFRTVGRLRERAEELRAWAKPAAALYTGQQHVLFMEGVRCLRGRYGPEAVTVGIVSAGYGLVSEEQLLMPYNATFSELDAKKRRLWAQEMRISSDVRDVVSGFPLVIILLGSHYLKAIAPAPKPVLRQRLVYLAKPAESAGLSRSGVTVVPAGIAQARAFGAGLVALKGKMFKLFAERLVEQGRPLWDAVCASDSPATFLRCLG